MSDTETRLCLIQVIIDKHLLAKPSVNACSVLDSVTCYQAVMVPDESDLDIWPPSGMDMLAALKSGSICQYIYYMKGTLFKMGLLLRSSIAPHFVQVQQADATYLHTQYTPGR